MRFLQPLPLLLAILTFGLSFLFHVSTAIPFNKTVQPRELFALDSYHEHYRAKRSLFNVNAIQDASQREVLRQGLRDALGMARIVLQNFGDERHKKKTKTWLGGEFSDLEVPISSVLNNFIGKDVNGEGADVLGDVIVYPDDYWVYTGTTLFCDYVQPDGKVGAAYYKPRDKKPGMHYCDRFFDRVDAKTFVADSCSSIEDHMNTDTMTRKFQGANVFHEFMHYPAITKQPTGDQVRDFGYGAWNCFLDEDGKLRNDNTANPILNADSWVWYVLHIYLEEVCGKEFSNPRGPQDN